MMRYAALILLSVLLLSFAPGNDTDFIKKAPTKTLYSLLRGGPGAYMAKRDGKLHSGVDIVANQTSKSKDLYTVMAVNNGKVAYAQINGTASTGYGYTVVVDHGNGYYSLYAHLAINASTGIVKLGDEVAIGQTIAFTADPANKELSSGNVRADVVGKYDKIQLHFECFKAPAGRQSTTTLSAIKDGSTLIDPTAALQGFGYSSF